MTALSRTELELLRADISANSSVAMNDDSRLDGPQLTLIGPWGDPLVFWRVGGDQWFAFIKDGRDQLFWTPGTQAASVIGSLLSRLTPPSSTAEPEPTPAADYCAARTPSPAGTPLPEGAERIRLCPWGADALRLNTPLDALESSGADAVLEQFGKLPAALTNDPCTAELGPELLMVLEPARGEPVVIQLQFYGCRLVGVPGAQRSGSDAVLASFRRELIRQRAITEPVAGRLRPGSWCGTATPAGAAVIPAKVEDTVAGRACLYDNRAMDAGPSLERTLTQAEVKLLSADIQARGKPATGRCSREGTPGRRVALATPWLDLILIDQSQCGGYTFAAGGESMAWTPSVQAEALLDKLLT
ncbi:MAG: hypothetical protein IPL43_14295 [Micropruina sp.]|nr:hypothetical protein [Micropruina sp.]